MDYLDRNRTEGKMCLSGWECDDIMKAFRKQDWKRIERYRDKYLLSTKLNRDEISNRQNQLTMTAQEIIEKIRAEIETKRDQNWESEKSYYDANDIKNAVICRHKRILCEYFLSFLSDLESEKPMDGLEEEIDRIVKCEKEFMNFQCRSQFIGYIARHFAKWGAEYLKK